MTSIAARRGFIVPDEHMVSVGAEFTASSRRCADSWSDSEIALLRSKLPIQYHAVPLDALRKRWINIRKRGTAGYRVSGHGPAVGSRIKPKHKLIDSRYAEYLASDSWKEKRKKWMTAWGHRCSICNTHENESILDVHHRTYARVGMEFFYDCVVLCRHCHGLYHDSQNDGSTLFDRD